MHMRESADLFSLLGGPLHRLGLRLGLVRGQANTFPLGLALGVLPWCILAILVLIEGTGKSVFSTIGIAGHVRLLVAIPLLFFSEALVTPRMTAFVRQMIESEIVRASELAAFDSELSRIQRWKDAWLPEWVCLLISIALIIAPRESQGLGLSIIPAALDMANAGSNMTLTAYWYWMVCLPLYRFLLLRWLWRLMLWWHFLWRLSKMNLHLVATHPDHAAGISFLEMVHAGFAPLILGMTSGLSATFVEAISIKAMPIGMIYPFIGVWLGLCIVLFICPLFVFVRQLRDCKVAGWAAYTSMGAHYVSDFEKKWTGRDRIQSGHEALLGTPDIQSLSDLNNSLSTVMNMRLAPVSKRLVVKLGMAVFLPLLPIFTINLPVSELMQILLKISLGV